MFLELPIVRERKREKPQSNKNKLFLLPNALGCAQREIQIRKRPSAIRHKVPSACFKITNERHPRSYDYCAISREQYYS